MTVPAAVALVVGVSLCPWLAPHLVVAAVVRSALNPDEKFSSVQR
jgi:hypothetical protein